MITIENKEKACKMLIEKEKCVGHIPHKNDFIPDEICFIKNCFGPWPRALEQAGLKEITIKGKDKRSKK